MNNQKGLTSIEVVQIIVILAIIIFVGIKSFPYDLLGEEKIYIGTVTKAYVKDDIYMVSIQLDGGELVVLKNTDTLFKHDSSDIFATIIVGDRYKFTVKGIRSTLFSNYQNIIEFTKEDKEK